MITFNKNLFTISIPLFIGAATFNAPVQADTRCGVERPTKQDAERTTANVDTAVFLNHVRDELSGDFTGYGVILTGSAGVRLGFRREGWAVDPCDHTPTTFTLNTENGIGSVTKLFTTVAVLKATQPNGVRLKNSFTRYLPWYWKRIADDFYDDISIEMLLQHQGGFLLSGNKHIMLRLQDAGPERGATDYNQNPRFYSNTGFGLFHFIYGKYGFRGTNFVAGERFHDIESDYANNGRDRYLEGYNERVQRHTSAAFNYGLYKQIFKPLEISASCDPRTPKFPPADSIKVPPNSPIQHFRFYTPSRGYASQTDNQGELLPPQIQNCASGGLSMSTKDLAKFVTALDDPDFLHPAHKERMKNDGPRNDLYGFTARSVGGQRAFMKNGAWLNAVSVVYVFPSGAHAVFVGNTSVPASKVEKVLADGYKLATGIN